MTFVVVSLLEAGVVSAAEFVNTLDTRVYLTDGDKLSYTYVFGPQNLTITNQSGQSQSFSNVASTNTGTLLFGGSGNQYILSDTAGGFLANVTGADGVRYNGTSNVVGSDGRLDGGTFDASTLGLDSASATFDVNGYAGGGGGGLLRPIAGPTLLRISANYQFNGVYKVTATISDSPITNDTGFSSTSSAPFDMTDRSVVGDFNPQITLRQELYMGSQMSLAFSSPTAGLLGTKTFVVSPLHLMNSTEVTTTLNGTLAVEEQFLPLGSPYVDALLKINGTLGPISPTIFPFNDTGSLTLTNEVVDLGGFGKFTLNGSFNLSQAGQITAHPTGISAQGYGVGVLNRSGVPEVGSFALIGGTLSGLGLIWIRRSKSK